MTDKASASRVALLDVAPRAVARGEWIGLPSVECDGEKRGDEERCDEERAGGECAGEER